MEFPNEGDSNRSNGGLGNNLTEFKQALKSGIERMETILQETESTASNDAQQYEELRQRAEVKVGLLGAQLQEMEESLRSKESAIKQLGENLTSKIQELEHRLTEKEKLSSILEKHNSEITILRSETEAKVGLLEGQLQEKEETLRSKESAIRQLEESLTSKIQELEHLVTEKEAHPGLLEKHNSEITILRSETEAKVGLLETQLQGKEETLTSKTQELEQCKREDGVAYRSKTSNMRGASRIRTILSPMVRMFVPSGSDRLTEKENLSNLLEKQLRDYDSQV